VRRDLVGERHQERLRREGGAVAGADHHEDRPGPWERGGAVGEGPLQLQVGHEVAVVQSGQHVPGALRVGLREGGRGGQPLGQPLGQLGAERDRVGRVGGQQPAEGRPVGVRGQAEAPGGEGDAGVDVGPGRLQRLLDLAAQVPVHLVGVQQHHRLAGELAPHQVRQQGGGELLLTAQLLAQRVVLGPGPLALLAQPLAGGPQDRHRPLLQDGAADHDAEGQGQEHRDQRHDVVAQADHRGHLHAGGRGSAARLSDEQRTDPAQEHPQQLEQVSPDQPDGL
jgi:hypothetical protein